MNKFLFYIIIQLYIYTYYIYIYIIICVQLCKICQNGKCLFLYPCCNGRDGGNGGAVRHDDAPGRYSLGCRRRKQVVAEPRIGVSDTAKGKLVVESTKE